MCWGHRPTLLNSGVPVTTFKVGIFLPLGGKTGFFHGKTVLAKIIFSGKGLFFTSWHSKNYFSNWKLVFSTALLFFAVLAKIVFAMAKSQR